MTTATDPIAELHAARRPAAVLKAKQFIEELKQMVAEIVHQVMADNTPRRI